MTDELDEILGDFIPHYGHQQCNEICPRHIIKSRILDLIERECTKAREEAKQEFREKFMIDPTKKYNVRGTERVVVIELAELTKERE